jgi:hypothetical protein
MNGLWGKCLHVELVEMTRIHMTWVLHILACSIAMLISAVALASEGQPVVRVGKHCPSGYRVSGEYCIPRSESSATSAIAKKGSCPSGYRKSGDYCVIRSGNNDTRHVIEKKGSCPSGYSKSGEYCVQRGN